MLINLYLMNIINSDIEKQVRQLADAQFKLGTCYLLGLGVKRNDTSAIECYTAAAEHNHAHARDILGWCNKNRIGDAVIPVDDKKCSQQSGRVQFVYLLECSRGKFYVGKTFNLRTRLIEHRSGNGAQWTRRYSPTDRGILSWHVSTSVHDEDNTTLDLMALKGIDNVRGGIFCQIDLPDHQLKVIKERLASTRNACFRCGKSSHFLANCPKIS